MTDKSDDERHPVWPMDKVRSTFIDFFVKKHGHTYWPSSPCVPHDDPTLLFTNAGMNQYKPLFLGTCDPNLEMSRLKRAVNSQKCIRAGGKHNDLDDVGKDVYHHTFFEMLGNWSFGDYFKEGAIEMAWTCLTEEFGLDPERIYASYFGGDADSPADLEARDIWLRYLPADRVLAFGKEDNFWEMGATGPCGPCVEVHYDRIGGRDASSLVNADLPDVIEIWNNVFVQYNREADGSLRPLPAKHIDTGMGFERLTSILQGVDSNYDTDIFAPIFESIRTVTGAPPYAGKVGADDVGYVDMAYRVVADHARTLCFSVADGATPSNDGRGYVLRRVLRRAVRYGRQNLGAELGFFSKLVPVVLRVMGATYPELVANERRIVDVIREEEESFGRTLDKGLVRFEEFANKTLGKGATVFQGEDAHFLYTSLGFPVDLTELMAEEKGMTLDHEGFHQKMDHERALSKRKTATDSGKDMTLQAEQTYALVAQQVPTTDDAAKYAWDAPLNDCVVKALFVGRNETEDNVGFVDAVSSSDGIVGVVLDRTSFYAEAGGQIFDTGALRCGDVVVRVDDAQIYGGFVLHLGEVVKGDALRVGDGISCEVDYQRRRPVASNHTMTHVLNHALREVLVRSDDDDDNNNNTSTVDQKGSLVDEHKLRYDFSWNRPLTPDELARVERLCNDRVRESVPVRDVVADLTEARALSTLRAVFGENYPDPVRVVSISRYSVEEMLADPTNEEWTEASVEFCGGTHLSNTSEAGGLALLGEEGVAKGVRRIVAVTGDAAAEAVQRAAAFEQRLHEAAADGAGTALEAAVKTLSEEVKTLAISTVAKARFKDTLAKLSKDVVAWRKRRVAESTKDAVEHLVASSNESPNDKVVCRFDFGVDGKVAKSVMAAFGKRVKDKAFLMASADADGDRFMVVAHAPKTVPNGGVDCKAWAASATEGTGGKGGGKKDSAQFTVTGLDKLEGVLRKAREF